jgi:hypothetical protein
MTAPPANKTRRSTAAQWERTWQKYWKKAGLLPYELNLSASQSENSEHSFLMQKRTLAGERARMKRIMNEFDRGFRSLHKLGPAVTVSAPRASNPVIVTTSLRVVSVAVSPRPV